jgi:ABC-type oligopeptide transport system substrate-binding subunit
MRRFLIAAIASLLCACAPQGIEDTARGPSTSSGGTFDFWPFGSSEEAADANQPQLGVNSFIWRATLDTLNFMPLTSADPVGGIVISDWYAAPDNPNEHMKVTVYILDRRLRADAVKVAVFRQVRGPQGWVDAQINPDTGVKLENAILTRARELRLASIPR